MDTCYGACIPTPCGACNTCIRSVRVFTLSVKDNTDAAGVASAWSTYCSSTLQRTSTSCEFIRAQILASPNGNLGKRAGLICQLLQDCASLPSDCKLEPAIATNAPAALDLCTVGGTAAGVQVPNVQSRAAFVLQDGQCFDNSNCTRAGQVCNKQLTTDVSICNAGVDSLVTLGTCVRTPCQTCKVSWFVC